MEAFQDDKRLRRFRTRRSAPGPGTARLYLNDGFGERVRDDVEQVRGVLARLDVEGVNQECGELVKDARRYLQRQKDQHRQPVKEVVDGRPGKGPKTRLSCLDWEPAAYLEVYLRRRLWFTCGTRFDPPPASWPRWCW